MRGGKMKILKFLSVVFSVIFLFATSFAEEAELDQRLPVLDCTVEYAYGLFDAYGAPQKGDRLKFDLDDYAKIDHMFEFESVDRPGPSYITLRAPFIVEKVKFASSGSFDHIRLLSEANEGKYSDWIVTFDVHRGAGSQPIVIITAGHKVAESVAVLLCQEKLLENLIKNEDILDGVDLRMFDRCKDDADCIAVEEYRYCCGERAINKKHKEWYLKNKDALIKMSTLDPEKCAVIECAGIKGTPECDEKSQRCFIK